MFRSNGEAVLLLKVVHAESQENGQKEAKRGKYEEEEDEVQGDEDRTQAIEEKVEPSLPAAMETQPPPDTSQDVETNTGNEMIPICCVFFNSKTCDCDYLKGGSVASFPV